jgi:hypothetical protein
VLDDIWENDVIAFAPGPAGLVAMHVAPTFAAMDFRPVGSVD